MTHSPLPPPTPRFLRSRSLVALWLFWLFWLGLAAQAELLPFNLPAQSAARALLEFSQQTGIEVLFPYDELDHVRSTEVSGPREPADAISRLLLGTGFSARRSSNGKFIVAADQLRLGSIYGRLRAPDGTPLQGLTVRLAGSLQNVTTDRHGAFTLGGVPPGTVTVLAVGPGYRPLQLTEIAVTAGRQSQLEPLTMQLADDLTRLDPYIVSSRSASQRPFEHSQMLETPLRAAGNLDLPRSENGALPYTIYDRDQLTRSGVVDLNDFLQRELLESDAATHPPGSGTSPAQFLTGSTNLNLRGYGADETVILVNGRRLPELLTTGSSSFSPDVNLIPLSLVQQVEVLPVSASSLYTGNAVGGVVNIVLRPEADTNASEITTTYTNAVHRYDAPQSSLALLHAHALLDGRLHLRLSAYFTHTEPPTEMELGYHQGRSATPFAPDASVYRATPNLRSANGSPLFGPGTSSVTSVAPGAEGANSLGAFTGRAGLRSLDLFDSPGSLSISPDSLDYPYGLRQRRQAWAGSVVYDYRPWLQLGFDAVSSRTVINRGLDVLRGDLTLRAGNPLNPFGQDVRVSLNETAPALGDGYSEAHIDFTSAVFGALFKLPSDWHLTFDGQFARNVVSYRGLSGVDALRWQQLVDTGLYNPLRDTQVYGPPAAFYDRALIYLGGRGRFVTLGDYETLDGAARITNQSLPLPTGPGVLNIGADYRFGRLAPYTQELRYADGTPAADPQPWTGRTLQRYSVFSELQGPLLPTRWLPAWIHQLEADLALRYVAAASSKESNLAPTVAFKLDTVAGVSFRASFTASSRIPTPQMSLPRTTGGGGGGALRQTLFDPRRQQDYAVQVNEDYAPALSPEESLTQTVGLIYQRGKVHRFRVALDFNDTRKTNEVVVLAAQDVANLEAILPARVQRAVARPGDPGGAGLITSVLTGAINTDWRHSQNWTATSGYSWTECLGGTLDLNARLLWYQTYTRQILPASPVVDELAQPDTLASSIIKYRANLGAAWNGRRAGFGVDSHYFFSRILPAGEWASQGSDRIRPFWQVDAYAQCDLTRWLPFDPHRYGLRAQLRVNNVFNAPYPKYANEGSGSGIQPYGDWRGRTYSLSLTATF